jgi:hypothetical protein
MPLMKVAQYGTAIVVIHSSLLFQVTAFLILIVDGLGCGVGVWALRTLQQTEQGAL